MTPIWRSGDPTAPLRRLLADGGVLAIPTESSYGLGASPTCSQGVDEVFRIKGRDAGKPLPVVVADVEQLVDLIGEDARLAVQPVEKHWPGPLSVLVPIAKGSLPAAAGRDSLAVRVPAHVGLRELLLEVGPLTATSANRAGEPPILEPGPLAALLEGHPATIVDGGILSGGPPSTLVDLRGREPLVLREGPVVWETPFPSHP